jgi:hypothetical protein
MVKGMEVGEGEAVRTAVEVGTCVREVELPGWAQEESRINGKRRKTILCCRGVLQARNAGILPENHLPRGAALAGL